MRSITIEIPGRPLTLNEVSGAGHWQASREKKTWRTAAGMLGKRHAKKLTMPVDISVTLHMKGRRFDHISPALAVKGATDGLVDAGVLANDSPRYIRRLIINGTVASDDQKLVFEITEVE